MAERIACDRCAYKWSCDAYRRWVVNQDLGVREYNEQLIRGGRELIRRSNRTSPDRRYLPSSRRY